MPEYYLTQNASRPVDAGAKKFTFEQAEYMTSTNSWWGILAVDDPADVVLLDAAVKKGLIEKISEDDYAKLEVKKKQPQSSPSLIELKHWHAPQIGGQTSQDAAPAVAAKREIELETLADAVAARSAVRAPAPKK